MEEGHGVIMEQRIGRSRRSMEGWETGDEGVRERERELVRERERASERELVREREREGHRQTDRQTDRQIEKGENTGVDIIDIKSLSYLLPSVEVCSFEAGVWYIRLPLEVK